MSIILERETEEYWPDFGETFMPGLRVAMIIFEGIFAAILGILALVLLVFGIIRIVGWTSALYERWYDRKQAKQGSDEEVVMGIIVSDVNERDVEYGVMAMDKPRGGE